MSFLGSFSVLDPAGSVGLAERGLMLHAVEFMLIVAVPVYFLIFYFAWRYRDRGADAMANQKDARVAYTPEWEHAKVDELIWWAIPLEIVLVLSALTWTSTHELDPRVPLEGGPPLVVEVVALDWKWLFIYPEQNIATVNYLQIPVDKPVRFEITADAPMNSFWIPQLGGQIYAMTGMSNTLNLVANRAGTFAGGSSNYSGPGFAQMKFVVEAVPERSFDAWADTVHSSAQNADLSHAAYVELSIPTVANNVVYYKNVEANLYEEIIQSFTGPSGSASPEQHH
jgi:cytochrome o ubiquinol oxidase subunit 2